jgi:hypothetical protein
MSAGGCPLPDTTNSEVASFDDVALVQWDRCFRGG